jgi:alpha-1,2-mannosyltransferase
VRIELLVFVAAFVTRLSVVVRSGGLRGSFGYDASVYYAASDALVHGRLPYRDYTLVHPPGIALALTPFAALGRLTSDHVGFAVATLAWMALGSVNAVLVVRLARRIGAGAPGALAGGLTYALWLGAVNAEFLIRLEPLGNFCLLCGLLAHVAAEDTGRVRAALLSGFGFGAAVAVKIWWVVPLTILLAWHLGRARRPRLGYVLAGAAAALFAIDGPFFVAAPRQMTSMVVSSQLGRARAGSVLQRLMGVTGADQLVAHPSRTAAVLTC